MPARQRAVRVPEDLRVVVRVQVDEARRDDHPAGVENQVGIVRLDVAELRNATVGNGHVAATPRHARSIDHHPAADHRVVSRHLAISSTPAGRAAQPIFDSQDATAWPISSGESSCTKWIPFTLASV